MSHTTIRFSCPTKTLTSTANPAACIMFVSLVVLCLNHTFVALRTSGYCWHVHIVAFCQLSFLMILRLIRKGIEHIKVKFSHSPIICNITALYDLCTVSTWDDLIGGSKDKRVSLIIEMKQSAYHKTKQTPERRTCCERSKLPSTQTGNTIAYIFI